MPDSIWSKAFLHCCLNKGVSVIERGGRGRGEKSTIVFRFQFESCTTRLRSRKNIVFETMKNFNSKSSFFAFKTHSVLNRLFGNLRTVRFHTLFLYRVYSVYRRSRQLFSIETQYHSLFSKSLLTNTWNTLDFSRHVSLATVWSVWFWPRFAFPVIFILAESKMSIGVPS